LQVGTRTKTFSFVGNIDGGREWVEDEKGIATRPIVQSAEVLHDVFNGIDQGSTFSLKLIGKFIRPKNLLWIGAVNAEQWSVVLRIKTPLGGIYFSKEGYVSPVCHLVVVDDKGNLSEKHLESCEYIYPHKVVSACKELREIRDIQKAAISKGKDGSRLPDSCYRLNGLFNYWSCRDLIESSEFALGEDDKGLVDKYKFSCYGFFCYSTEIWEQYNDEVVKLRKGERILKGGLQLATNCMPQGDLLIIPLTKNIGYQNVAHVVVHFEEADPDLGRKGFQPELEALAQNLSTKIVKIFLNWKRLLKRETGAPPDIVEEKNIHDWIKEQEAHEKAHPLVINRQDIFLPIKEPSITSEPLNEQDVIALFNQLLAGGVIRGIKLMATNQHEQYDGMCKFHLQKPFSNHVFDKNSNPLGIERDRIKDEFISSPHILEYKYSFDALLEDIEKEEKTERQIRLVVVWEMGKNWSKRYEITPLLHFSNLHHRYFHGGTHIIKNSSTGDIVFPAIVLSELISYLNDPDAVQDFQRSKYMQ